jgi:hypothetical protein
MLDLDHGMRGFWQKSLVARIDNDSDRELIHHRSGERRIAINARTHLFTLKISQNRSIIFTAALARKSSTRSVGASIRPFDPVSGSRDGAPASRTRYIEVMQYVLPALVVVAMLATLGTLFLGIISMAKGGNPQRSNKLMRSRVMLQGAALILFVIFMLIYRHG